MITRNILLESEMQLYELLNELLKLLIPCSEEKINEGDFYLNIANCFF